jgi:uncharacterized protein (DUF433 family)
MFLSYRSLAADEADRFRFAVAAAYFAWAAATQMLDNIKRNYDAAAKRSLDEYFAIKVPRYKLLDDFRVQDFHRHAVLPPRSGWYEHRFQGPMRVHGDRQGVTVQGLGANQRIFARGNSYVKQDRPLVLTSDGLYDDTAKEYVPLDVAVREFLNGLDDVVSEFLDTDDNRVRAARARLADLPKKFAERITVEPGKRGGKPCIRGLRIAVNDVVAYITGGMTREQVIEEFPELTVEDIDACLAFAGHG